MSQAPDRAAASDCDALADRLGHRFSQPGLLEQALTHPSSGGGRRSRRDRAAALAYERLEFLGDRVLNLIVADMLLAAFPDEPEGALAKRHAALVRRETIAQVARRLDLAAHLILGAGEASSGGRDNPAILADALEAVIGALYRDGGLAAAQQFVQPHWQDLVAGAEKPPQDAKTQLQEWAQARGLPRPAYRLVAQRGPAHEPAFDVAVEITGYAPVVATAGNKRQAEMAAARRFLEAGDSAGDEEIEA